MNVHPGESSGIANRLTPLRLAVADWLQPPWHTGPLTARGTAAIAATAAILAYAIATQPLRYVGGAIGALTVLGISLVRPEFGLAMIVLTIPFNSLVEVSVAGSSVTVTEPLIALVSLAWVLRLAAAREARIRWTPLFLPFVVYLLLLAQSVAVAPALSLAIKEYLKWGEALALMLVAANVLRTKQQLLLVIGSMLLAGSLAAVQGWYQFIFRQGPEGFLIAGRFLRAYGTFGQPNPYAGYLNLILPLALAILLVFLTAGQRKQPSRRVAGDGTMSIVIDGKLLFLIAAIGLMLGAEAMSLSRAAWFGLLFAGVALMAFRSKKTLLFLLIALIAGLLVALLGALDLLPAVVTERLSVLTDSFSIFDINQVELTPENWSIVERMMTWQTAWDMFVTSPWFGIGPGGFQTLFRDFAPLDWVLRGANPPHAHNYYLNALAESGVIGLIGYLTFVVSTFAYTSVRIRAARRLQSPAEHPYIDPLALSLGCLGVLLALAVHNVFDNNYVHSMTAQLGLMLGVVEAGWLLAIRREEGA